MGRKYRKPLIPEPIEVKLCEICYEEVELNRFYTLACGHGAMLECLKDYFLNLIGENKASKMTCIYPDCSIVPNDGELINIIGIDQYYRL